MSLVIKFQNYTNLEVNGSSLIDFMHINAGLTKIRMQLTLQEYAVEEMINLLKSNNISYAKARNTNNKININDIDFFKLPNVVRLLIDNGYIPVPIGEQINNEFSAVKLRLAIRQYQMKEVVVKNIYECLKELNFFDSRLPCDASLPDTSQAPQAK